MTLTTSRLAALALSLAVIGAAGQPALAAEDDPQAQQTAQQSGSTPEFGEQKLDAFADAAVKVSQVRSDWAPKIRKAQQNGDDQKAQELSKQATGEMRSSIEETDNISVQEYQQIAQAAQQDQNLAKELSSMMQEKMPNQGQQGGQQ